MFRNIWDQPGVPPTSCVLWDNYLYIMIKFGSLLSSSIMSIIRSLLLLFSCQSCPTLVTPKDYGSPGSSVCGIFQARILEWWPFPSSGDLHHQGLNPCLMHCRSILYHRTTWKVYHRKFISVQFNCSVMSNTLRPRESQHAKPPWTSPTPGFHPNSCPLSRWCHPAISSSIVPFSSCPQSLPASGSFLMSQLFAWGGQSTGVSASALVLPMNTQDWSPLGWTGWISLQSKGLSRVFSNTTVQKHQFFSSQLSSQSNSHIHTWPLKKP